MSSAIHPSYTPASAGAAAPAARQPLSRGHRPVLSMAVAAAPAGTFAPGTKVQVGGHRVVVEKYLSEGGFAHVYLVRLPQPIAGDAAAVLKRVAVPDKEALAGMRTEVETMKRLRGHGPIVRYIDSHASQLQGGGYEVFLLMEYCSGGGLIDFMNTRLQTRLTEPEIVGIFGDVALGVACMHYLKPPLLHRDLKVENVLIVGSGATKKFKLCDFGSAAPPQPAATNAAEGRLIEEDVQKHTTMQYRSPEMIDVYRKQPIDEKSDIWALGVLLYKLCYYTTPFEEQGQMAILNASFKYPAYPPFSDRLKKLIATMLQERPSARPNIYQVVRDVCSMRGTEVPIKDIYSGRTVSEARRNQELPDPHANVASPPVIGVQKATTVEEKPKIPEITPMRRGRPTNLTASHLGNRPSPSPGRAVSNDPFAALDASSPPPASTSFDDASQRFPSLDQFSLLHDNGGAFAFEPGKPKPPEAGGQAPDRMTAALADEAFATAPATAKEPLSHSKSLPGRAVRTNVGTRTSVDARKTPVRSSMVSTGTMTSAASASVERPPELPSRPATRMTPSELRSSSQPRPVQTAKAELFDRNQLPAARPSLLEHRSRSQVGQLSTAKATASPRSSFEGERPTRTELDDLAPAPLGSKTKVRPVSSHFENATKFLRGRSPSRGRSSETAPSDARVPKSAVDDSGEAPKIDSEVDFLKAMEEDDSGTVKRKEKCTSSGLKHGKRASLPSISLSGTKSLLAGRFGEAFRRFEANQGEGAESGILDNANSDHLTPIAGSEATDGRSDDGHIEHEAEDAPPEVRRELERRRLSAEERRVADAAAAYKQQVASGGPGRSRDATRARTIQNKVQSLLDETSRPSPTKTAEGYGRFTDSPRPVDTPQLAPSPGRPPQQPSPVAKLRASDPVARASTLPSSAPAAAVAERPFARPSAPPKPHALRTGGGRIETPFSSAAPAATAKPSHLAAKKSAVEAARPDAGATPSEDWEASFSRRYPSLSGLEMVETEINKGDSGPQGIRNI